MASSAWVVNTSPLILLGKIDRLDLLGALAGRVAVPQAVADEVGAKGGGATLRAMDGLHAFVTVGTAPIASDVLSWNLGPGETQVIAHALSQGADRVVLDDLQARRCAAAMGLRIIGTLGLVGRAKVQGLIGQAEPIITRLRESGLYVTDALVHHLLAEIGER